MVERQSKCGIILHCKGVLRQAHLLRLQTAIQTKLDLRLSMPVGADAGSSGTPIAASVGSTSGSLSPLPLARASSQSPCMPRQRSGCHHQIVELADVFRVSQQPEQSSRCVNMQLSTSLQCFLCCCKLQRIRWWILVIHILRQVTCSDSSASGCKRLDAAQTSCGNAMIA